MLSGENSKVFKEDKTMNNINQIKMGNKTVGKSKSFLVGRTALAFIFGYWLVQLILLIIPGHKINLLFHLTVSILLGIIFGLFEWRNYHINTIERRNDQKT